MPENRDELIRELRTSLGRMETALDVIDEAILWTDREGRLRWCNGAFVRLAEKPKVTLLGKPAADMLPLHSMGQPLPPEAHPLSLALATSASQSGSFETTGHGTNVRVDVSPFSEIDGAGGAVMVIRDLSGELSREDERIRGAALAAAADAIAILDAAGKILWINAAFTRLTGYGLDEVHGHSLRVLRTRRQNHAFYGGLWETVRSGTPWSGELVNRRKDGTTYHEYQTIAPVTDAYGDVGHFIVFKQDVTAKVLAERTIREREARLSALFRGVPDAVVIADDTGRIESVNPAAERIFGYAPGELLGRNARDLTPPELRPMHDGFIRRYIETGVPHVIGIGREAEAVRKDGSRFPIELSISDIRTPGKLMFTAIVRDVTQRRAQEAELWRLYEEVERRVEERTRDLSAKSEELAREVAERRQAEVAVREGEMLLMSILLGIGAAFIIIDQETGRFAGANAVAADMLGLELSGLDGQECRTALAPLGEQTTAAICVDNHGGYAETTIRNRDGDVIPVARHVLPIRIDDKPHLAVIFFDITERRNLERQLGIAQRLESIGQLASGIAHEINTPIQYVGDSLRFIREAHTDLEGLLRAEEELTNACGADGDHADLVQRVAQARDAADYDFLRDELPRAFQRAEEGVDRVATIVRAMKSFSHPGTEDKKAVDLNEAVETTVTVARNEWKYVAEVVTDLDPGRPEVLGFSSDLKQVILNMIVNSAHAIADKVQGTDRQGTITLTTRNADGMVELRIADTGTGIPEAVQDKVFNPFFTTKEVGKGTGQGLAIVHDIIVGKHEGSITLDSVPGEGTTFTIRLPAYRRQQEAGA